MGPLPTSPSGHLSPDISTSSTATAVGSDDYITNDLPEELPSVIPPRHGVTGARTLVLCFDGTGDQFDTDNSNVIQFFQLLMKDNRREQMVYYQAGIGTYTIPQIATPFVAKLEKTLDEMIAWNLDAHVMGGYEFLMQNYEAGDKICIFGFSRGAYTARALAGMIHKVGLIPPCNHQQVPFAYKMFTRTDEEGWKQSTAFKKAFSIDVDIEFVGVWDTVCSVGLFPRSLPFTATNKSIRTFRHAVSLDEHRAKFKANLFNRSTKQEERLGTQEGDMPKSRAPEQHPLESMMDSYLSELNAQQGQNGSASSAKALMKSVQRRLDAQSAHRGHSSDADVLEVWFAGCHCDVGGGSVANDTRHSLARIPLRWMIRQCFLANTGIRFHTELLRTVGLDPASLYPYVRARPPPLTTSPYITPAVREYVRKQARRGTKADTAAALVNFADVDPVCLSEEEEDLADAFSPMYDQLQLAPFWWVLEVVPMTHKVQKADNRWVDEYYVNMGRGRKLPKAKMHSRIHVHRTVKLRMDAENLEGGPYGPRLQLNPDLTIWAD